MEDEQYVKSYHPEAESSKDAHVLAYARWKVYREHSTICLGSGHTEAQAWRNAAIHVRSSEDLSKRPGNAAMPPDGADPRSW